MAHFARKTLLSLVAACVAQGVAFAQDAQESFLDAVRMIRKNEVEEGLAKLRAAVEADPSSEEAFELWKAANAAHGVDVWDMLLAQGGEFATLARTLIERGLRIVSGRTESHVMLVDLRPKGLTGKEAEAVLGAAHITCNKNGIPNDPQKPMVTSGIRLGTPAMTTRGFREEQARQTAHLIADVLDRPHDEAAVAEVRAKVAVLTRDFPVYR